ncbi:MAG: helix-turn-helix transcriptional regulator [Pseudomonadota bacterium]
MTIPNDPKVTDQAVGEVFRRHRKYVGFSQDELGRKIGTSAQQIQKYETGQNRVSVHRLLSAARAFGVHPSKLIDEIHLATGGAEGGNSSGCSRESDFLETAAARRLVSSLVDLSDEAFAARLADLVAEVTRVSR